jgi:hypothetical protein
MCDSLINGWAANTTSGPNMGGRPGQKKRIQKIAALVLEKGLEYVLLRVKLKSKLMASLVYCYNAAYDFFSDK